MALPSSGSLNFSQIEAEFGSNSTRALGSYRSPKTGSYPQTVGELSFGSLDTGIPTSGTIKFGDFRGKKLNVVVDCYSGGTEYRVNARTAKYNSNAVNCIGKFKEPSDRPNNTSGTKIIIHVDKTFGSTASSFPHNPDFCALRTGSWETGCDLRVDVGGNGAVWGAGGKGGDGADGITDYGPTTPGNGLGGTSGLGCDYHAEVVIKSGGLISAGYGGGGGGRGARQVDRGADRTACGGGAGGGAGLPVGAAGEGGQRLSGGSDEVASASDGGTGSAAANGGGAGGSGGNNAGEAIGQTGGVGGDHEQVATAGSGGSNIGSGSDSGQSTAGANGSGVRKDAINGWGTTIVVESGGICKPDTNIPSGVA